MKRASLVLLVLTGAAVALTLPAGAAERKDPGARKLDAAMVVQYQYADTACGNCGPGGGPATFPTCSYAIFVEFPEVKGGEDYHVVLRDNDPRVNTTYDLHGPPFQDDVEGYRAPAGMHRFGGFTSGSGGAPCAVTDPYMGGRFKILKAEVAIGQTRVVAGRLRARARGGVGRIKVNLVGLTGQKWRVIASTRSDVQGNYELRAPAGRKNIKRWRVGPHRSGFCVAGVRACAEVAEITFDKSGDDDRRTVNFETDGRHRDVWGSDVPNDKDGVAKLR
jgi:hypothetical protein